MTNSPTWIRSSLVCVLLAVTFVAAGARALDRTIAKINNDIVTESDLAEVIAELKGRQRATGIVAFEQATSDSVCSLLDRALLLQEARRLQITPPQDEIHRQVEGMVREIKESFPEQKDFYQALASERLSLDQLKEQLTKKTKEDFMVFHVVDSRFSVTESDVAAHEPDNTSGSQSEVSYRLRRLGIPYGKKVSSQEALRQVSVTVARTITEGISFEEGVRRYSQVPGAAEDGGDMGYMASNELNATVRAAVENLEIGQASAPVLAGGYANIFYVEGKRGVKSAVREKKFFEARGELLQSLRRKAVLQIFDERLTPLLSQEYSDRLRGTVPATGVITPSPRRQNLPEGEPAAAPSTQAAAPTAQGAGASVDQHHPGMLLSAPPGSQLPSRDQNRPVAAPPQPASAPAGPGYYAPQPEATPTPEPRGLRRLFGRKP